MESYTSKWMRMNIFTAQKMIWLVSMIDRYTTCTVKISVHINSFFYMIFYRWGNRTRKISLQATWFSTKITNGSAPKDILTWCTNVSSTGWHQLQRALGVEKTGGWGWRREKGSGSVKKIKETLMFYKELNQVTLSYETKKNINFIISATSNLVKNSYSEVGQL